MSKGKLWAATGGFLLDEIRAEEAADRAFRRQESARATERAQERASAAGASGYAGIPAGPRYEARMTRAEVAELLNCSERTVQRMEAAGRLRRCAGMGSLVRFDRSDVLRLVSASRREA